jgi:hypothetical protein
MMKQHGNPDYPFAQSNKVSDFDNSPLIHRTSQTLATISANTAATSYQHSPETEAKSKASNEMPRRMQ